MTPDNSIEPEEPVKSTPYDDVSRVGDLEIDIDPGFQQKEWRWERTGWGMIALAIAGALLGLFSTGPLSKTFTGTKPGGIRVKYDRFARRMAPSMMEVALESKASRDGEARIWFSRRYIEQFEVVRVTPEPSRTEAGEERIVYTFDTAEPAQPMGITFYLRSEKSGALSGSVGLVEGATFPLRQFIYP